MRTLLVLALAACSGEKMSSPDAATTDAPRVTDAAIDAAGFGTSCTGACATTNLTASFQATRTLDRAYYGVTAADSTLHVEAYRGGGSGCPTMTSPTPDYTLVLGRVPMPTSSATSSSPGNILDYRGDLLGGPLGAMATAVTITPVAADTGNFVALDVMLTFAAGTVTGHLYATHCTSLDS